MVGPVAICEDLVSPPTGRLPRESAALVGRGSPDHAALGRAFGAASSSAIRLAGS
jgi:hypothetical protein